jgi:hypothetical protein
VTRDAGFIGPFYPIASPGSSLRRSRTFAGELTAGVHTSLGGWRQPHDRVEAQRRVISPPRAFGLTDPRIFPESLAESARCLLGKIGARNEESRAKFVALTVPFRHYAASASESSSAVLAQRAIVSSSLVGLIGLPKWSFMPASRQRAI